jgi:hypothetical protein
LRQSAPRSKEYRVHPRRVAVISAVVAILAMLVVTSVAWAGASHRRVQLLDDCDAESFNAVLGPGA